MEVNKLKYRSPKKQGIIFGIALILLGVLFLAFNFGVFQENTKRLIFSWQMLLIMLAVVSFIYRHLFNGLILLIVGIFFIIPKLALAYPDTFSFVNPDFTRTYWPVLLISAGILLIVKLFYAKQNYHYSIYSDNYRDKGRRRKHSSDGSFERNCVFGNAEEIILDPAFTGGELNAVFGNIVLDLRKTTIPEGDTEIELNAVFGGITIYVPENWNIELHLDTFFGGFADNRKASSETDYSRKLIVIGACVFGGGEIKN